MGGQNLLNEKHLSAWNQRTNGNLNTSTYFPQLTSKETFFCSATLLPKLGQASEKPAQVQDVTLSHLRLLVGLFQLLE